MRLMSMMLSLAVILTTQFLFGASHLVCNVDKKNPCRCSWTDSVNGSTMGIDISSMFDYPKNTTVEEGSDASIMYTPCKPIAFNGSKPALIWLIRSGQGRALGRESDMSWIINSTDHKRFTIHYGNGDPYQKTKRSASVHFIVEDVPPKFRLNTKNSSTYELEAVGSGVIFTQSHSERKQSGFSAGVIGWILMSMFLAAMTMYCVIGAVYNYKVKGERGSQVIPNAVFWKELPLLVKDGVLFSARPCTSRCRNSKTKYENL